MSFKPLRLPHAGLHWGNDPARPMYFVSVDAVVAASTFSAALGGIENK